MGYHHHVWFLLRIQPACYIYFWIKHMGLFQAALAQVVTVCTFTHDAGV